MTFEGEAKDLLHRLNVNSKQLTMGWNERVKYKIPVVYHNRDKCSRNNPTVVGKCECPVVNEERTKSVRRAGLLDQLKDYQQNKDVDRNPKAARGAPRVKKPKMHPELAGFFALDEISCEAYMLLDRIFEEVGRDRTWLAMPIASVVLGLEYQVSMFVEERPDLAREVVRATDRWIAKARGALKVTVSDAVLGDTVCGNCGGGLMVAWDNSSDVRCVGTTAEPSCGETYPMEEWVSLYEQQRAK